MARRCRALRAILGAVDRTAVGREAIVAGRGTGGRRMRGVGSQLTLSIDGCDRELRFVQVNRLTSLSRPRASGSTGGTRTNHGRGEAKAGNRAQTTSAASIRTSSARLPCRVKWERGLGGLWNTALALHLQLPTSAYTKNLSNTHYPLPHPPQVHSQSSERPAVKSEDVLGPLAQPSHPDNS